MARALTADPSPDLLVHLPDSPAPAAPGRSLSRRPAAADALEPAIAACEAAIAYRVRAGTRPSGGGLLAALVDAVEVGQTALDLARRDSPLVPEALGLCARAFRRAEELCRARGDAALLSCAEALDQAERGLATRPLAA